MKRFLLFINCLLIAFLAEGQYLQWNDLLKESSGGRSLITGSSLNNSGYIFSFGNFSGTLDLDPNLNSSLNISSPSSSLVNLFFAKYDGDGDLMYGRHIWGKSNLSNGGLALDGADNLFLSGYFNDSIDLNPGNNQAFYSPVLNNAVDAFLVKYNNQGEFQWARQFVS